MIKLIQKLQKYHIAFIVLALSVLSYLGLSFLMDLERYSGWFPVIPQLLHYNDDFLVATSWLSGRRFGNGDVGIPAFLLYCVIYAHDALWVVIVVAGGKLIGEKRVKRDSEA